MKTYSKEQRSEYFAGLRARWTANKVAAEADPAAHNEYLAFQSVFGAISFYSYYFTLCDMKRLGLDGQPYIDCKTFNRWKENGFIVKKGEHAKIDGITWIVAKNKDGSEDEDGAMYPKLYKLFHKSQVEAIK